MLLRRPIGDVSYEIIAFDVSQGLLTGIANEVVPLEWVQINWSRDEAHISIVVGDLVAARRNLHVVDLWDDESEGELPEFCLPSTEAEPTCVGSVVF